ncbi:MAG: glycosyltransferase family 1 protein, partial [Bacteroidota bacterium]
LRSKVPTVMVTHDIAHVHYPEQVPGLVRRYYNYFVPRYLKRAESVVTVSEYVKQDIIQHYGLAPEKLSVACNGVQPAFQSIAAKEQLATRQQYAAGQDYFFYLGAVHPRKNVPRLIAAYDAYRQQGGRPAKLLLGGRLAWQTAATQAAHQQAQYLNDIHFLGYVPADDLPKLLGSAKALVYPSLNEGFGVPVLEAMWAEVPVITSHVTSLPEVAGEAALLVDPNSVEQIIAAMRRIDREPALAKQLIQAGRLQREKFSWDKATEVVAGAIKILNKE